MTSTARLSQGEVVRPKYAVREVSLLASVAGRDWVRIRAGQCGSESEDGTQRDPRDVTDLFDRARLIGRLKPVVQPVSLCTQSEPRTHGEIDSAARAKGEGIVRGKSCRIRSGDIGVHIRVADQETGKWAKPPASDGELGSAQEVVNLRSGVALRSATQIVAWIETRKIGDHSQVRTNGECRRSVPSAYDCVVEHISERDVLSEQRVSNEYIHAMRGLSCTETRQRKSSKKQG